MKLIDPLKLGEEVEAALDVLTSTDALKPLAANQGRVLKAFIDSTNVLLYSDDSTLDELQEIVTYIKQNKTDLSALGISNIAGLLDALAGKEATFAKNEAFNLDFGSTAGTVVEGNDARLNDAKNWVRQHIRNSATGLCMYVPGVANDYSDLLTKMSGGLNDAVFSTVGGSLKYAQKPATLNPNLEGKNIYVQMNTEGFTNPDSDYEFNFDNLIFETVTGDGITIYSASNTYSGGWQTEVRTFGYLFVKDWDIDNRIAEITAKTKPEKYITNATQYTAILEDKGKYLVFKNGINFIIPSDIFAKNDVIEGEVEGLSDVTVVAGTNVGATLTTTINKAEPLTPIIPRYGVIGLRFRSASNATLYGTLKPL